MALERGKLGSRTVIKMRQFLSLKIGTETQGVDFGSEGNWHNLHWPRREGVHRDGRLHSMCSHFDGGLGCKNQNVASSPSFRVLDPEQ